MLDKMNKKLLAFSIIFLFVELVLFVLIFAIHGRANDWISFSSIVTVFIFSLFLICKNKNVILTQIALLTTSIADLFLIIVQPRQQLMAMIFFSVTQICYFIRLLLNAKNKTEKIVHISVRAGLTAIVFAVTAIVLKEKTDALSMVSMFYFTNLILNVIFAFVQIKRSILFPIGLLFFMICDIFIGLQCAIGVYIDVPENNILYQIAFSPFNWAWLFYVPAQILIVLSLIINNKNHIKEPAVK